MKDRAGLHEYLSDADVIMFEPYKKMSMDEVFEKMVWSVFSDEMAAVELNETEMLVVNI